MINDFTVHPVKAKLFPFKFCEYNNYLVWLESMKSGQVLLTFHKIDYHDVANNYSP